MNKLTLTGLIQESVFISKGCNRHKGGQMYNAVFRLDLRNSLTVFDAIGISFHFSESFLLVY